MLLISFTDNYLKKTQGQLKFKKEISEYKCNYFPFVFVNEVLYAETYINYN